MPESRNRTSQNPLNSSASEINIPHASPNPPSPNTEVSLILDVKFVPNPRDKTKKLLYPYFNLLKPTSRRKLLSDPGSLDIKVDQKGVTRFHIQLTDSISWAFRKMGEPMTLSGKVENIYLKNYPRLKTLSSQHIWFDAEYISLANGKPALHHGFNLFVELTQLGSARPILLKIDPDILNPGDHPPITGTGGAHR